MFNKKAIISFSIIAMLVFSLCGCQRNTVDYLSLLGTDLYQEKLEQFPKIFDYEQFLLMYEKSDISTSEDDILNIHERVLIEYLEASLKLGKETEFLDNYNEVRKYLVLKDNETSIIYAEVRVLEAIVKQDMATNEQLPYILNLLISEQVGSNDVIDEATAFKRFSNFGLQFEIYKKFGDTEKALEVNHNMVSALDDWNKYRS